jgi:hypothetical protein
MKNKFFITGLLALLITALPALSQNDAVYSVNIIGMQKQPVVQNLQMLANPFERMTIKDLVGTSGVAGNSADIADNVILYNPDTQAYVTYYLRNLPSPSFLQWLGPSGIATNVFIEPGMGFFYRSRTSESRTNTVVGDVVMSSSITNVIKPGLQLLSYPYSVGKNMSDLNLKGGVSGSALDVADNIVLFNSGTQAYITYYLRNLPAPSGLQWLGPQGVATNVVINPGQSFFFRSRVTSNYNWVETSPYPDL